MKAHFFDIDTLIKIDNSVWLVSKNKPSIPIIKLTESEFNLIKKGIYKKYNSMLNIDDVGYWLPENLYNTLKIKSKSMKFNITDLSFSLQEFMNTSIIENLDYTIYKKHFQHLRNKNDDIYIICSKKSKSSYKTIIDSLEKELGDMNLVVKDYYFLSETFYNRDKDYISYLKTRLLLQHLFGYKTDGDKFTDTVVENYNTVHFYDENKKSIDLAININDVFTTIMSNTSDGIKNNIHDITNRVDKYVMVREVTYNQRNIFKQKDILIHANNLVKTFETFKYLKI